MYSPSEISYRATMISYLAANGHQIKGYDAKPTDQLEQLCDSLLEAHMYDAAWYASLIQPCRESYKQTTIRLREAIGQPINPILFHDAVRIIRFKFSDDNRNSTSFNNAIPYYQNN